MSEFPYKPILQKWQMAVGHVVKWEIAHHKHTVFYITTDIPKYLILKKITNSKNQEKLKSEYNVLKYLSEQGVPVSVPLLTDDNDFYVESDGYIFTLSPNLLIKNNLYTNYQERYFAIGGALGHLHKALATYPYIIPSWTMNLPQQLETDILPTLAQKLPTQQSEYLQQQLARFKQDIYDLWNQLPTQYIHGDSHGGNILFNGKKVVGFIDFDHLPTGARVYDLSYFLADEIKTRINAENKLTNLLSSFKYLIEGYEQESIFTAQEKNAVWYGMLITQLLFINWFIKNDDTAQVRKNLQVFTWLCNNRQEFIDMSF